MKLQIEPWSEILEKIESLVIQGQHGEAKQFFEGVNLKQIPKVQLAPFAELACRMSEPIMALKLLNDVVCPENRFALSATDKEKFIYATALANLGAVHEAIEMFSTIDHRNEPEVLLRKAMAYFRDWNYTAAVPLLEDYLKQSNLAPYRQLIGKVNLAAAFVIENRFDEAQQLLNKIKQVCEENSYLLLLGNTFELQGQIQFFQKDFDQAELLLDQSMRILKNQGGEFFLFAEKWKLINRLFQNNNEKNLNALVQFRFKAKSLNEFETVRDCDLFESVLTQNGDLFRKVIMGTPSEHYRRRARQLFGKIMTAQGNFTLELGSEQPTENHFSFNPYEVQNNQQGLYTKPQLLALFEALMVDFYKPSYIGLLFQRIYKNEKFSAYTSPQRVLSLMKRLNQWFAEKKVPLQVKFKKSEFQIIAIDSACVRIFLQRTKPLSKEQGQLFSLKQHFKDRTFSAMAVSEKMDISKSSAQNLILQAIENGYIKKMGTGRSTTYSIISKSRKKVAA